MQKETVVNNKDNTIQVYCLITPEATDF